MLISAQKHQLTKAKLLCYTLECILKGSFTQGEVSEWFKELVLKTSDSARGRGFESHPLRHKIQATKW
jgi:hypothetical protein